MRVEPWPETALGDYLAKCAGLVIDRHVAPALRDLPGTLTDTKLRRI